MKQRYNQHNVGNNLLPDMFKLLLLLLDMFKSKLHTKLLFLEQIFLKSNYPESFIKKCFKKFLDNIHVVKEATLTEKKKSYALVLPYLGWM